MIMVGGQYNKINVAIVGYGYIAKYWEKAISKDSRMNIAGIYDSNINDSGTGRNKFYNTLDSLLDDAHINACIICTPTDYHYETAMEILSSGKNIVVEKPSVLNMEEYNNLLAKAYQKHALIYNAFHFVYSPEIAWFRSALPDLYKQYGRIGSFYSYFSDPYFIGGELKDKALSLLGSWVDSGSNILSMLYSIFDNIWLDSLTFGDSYAGNFSDLFSTGSMKFKDLKGDTGFGHTVTNWVSNSSFKYTDFMFPQTDSKIRLNHSELTVTLSNGTGSELLFSAEQENRLLAHYTGLVPAVYESLSSGKGNEEYGKMVYNTMYSRLNGGDTNAGE